MAETILVTPAQLREAADILETCASNIDQRVDSTSQIIEGAIQGVRFQGHRADSLIARYRQTNPTMQTWPGYLTQFAQLLRQAAAAFETADQTGPAFGRGGDIAGVDWEAIQERYQHWLDALPPDIRERLGQDTSLLAILFEKYGHLETLADAITGMDSIFEELTEEVVEKLTDWVGHSDGGIKRVLGFITNPAFEEAMEDFVPPILSGLVEFGLEGDYTWTALGTEVGSGAIQGLMSMTGVGSGILIGDAALQLVGWGASELIEQNAMWFATGNAGRAAEIIATADRFQGALDAASLDARLDGMVNAVLTGDLGQIGEEAFTGLWGLGGVVYEGGTLATQSVGGVVDQIAANTLIDETLHDFGNVIGDVGGDVLDFLGF